MHLVKRFVSYYKPHRKLFAIDMACAFIVAVCDLFYPIIAGNIIDDYVPNQNLRLLLIWSGVLLGIYLVKAVLNYVIQYLDEFNDPIIGALIHEIDKNNRVYSNAATDINGEFTLQVKNPKNKLRVTYIGYDPQTLDIEPKMEIHMKDANVMNEVVVTAQKMSSDNSMPIPQREISGATQTLNTKVFEGLSVSSVDDALQGRMAGLDIVSASGDLGSGSSMRIRGSGSINANAEPLIVLNDIPYESHVDESFDYANATSEQFANLLSINPEDIEEITVL